MKIKIVAFVIGLVLGFGYQVVGHADSKTSFRGTPGKSFTTGIEKRKRKKHKAHFADDLKTIQQTDIF